MPDDSYCPCGDAAEFTVTEGSQSPQNRCPRCTVLEVRDHIPENWTIDDIPDEFEDGDPDASEPRHHREPQPAG